MSMAGFEFKMKKLTVIKGELPSDLKQFLEFPGSDSGSIAMDKLIQATNIFLKSHYLKSYGLVKNKLPLITQQNTIFDNAQELGQINEESF